MNFRNWFHNNGGRIALAVYAVVWIAGALLLFGCTPTATLKDYDRGDAPEPQFTRDAAACEQTGDEHRSVDIALWGAPVSYNRLFDDCMRAKGYARKT